MELSQIGNFSVPQHLDPVRMKVIGISGEGKAGFLDTRTEYSVLDPSPTRNEGQVKTILRIIEEVFY
jgi:hypothetical protein